MLIGGLQKLSLIDYPGQLAAVIFTRGCPLRCQFCHNASLVIPSLYEPLIPEAEIFAFLEKRKNQLDGVVITGGEPTIQKDLVTFISKIKKMGYSIKLDTCGTNPAMIEELFKKQLLDYIAMDLKAPLKNYQKVTGVQIDPKVILKSIGLILSSKIKTEFRSTLVRDLHNSLDVVEMVELIKGAPLYTLQKYINKNPLNPALKGKQTFSDQELLTLKQAVEKKVQACRIR